MFRTAIILACVAVAACGSSSPAPQDLPPVEQVELKRCVDKDTIMVEESKCEAEEKRRASASTSTNFVPLYYWYFGGHPGFINSRYGHRIGGGAMTPVSGRRYETRAERQARHARADAARKEAMKRQATRPTSPPRAPTTTTSRPSSRPSSPSRPASRPSSPSRPSGGRR